MLNPVNVRTLIERLAQAEQTDAVCVYQPGEPFMVITDIYLDKIDGKEVIILKVDN